MQKYLLARTKLQEQCAQQHVEFQLYCTCCTSTKVQIRTLCGTQEQLAQQHVEMQRQREEHERVLEDSNRVIKEKQASLSEAKNEIHQCSLLIKALEASKSTMVS